MQSNVLGFISAVFAPHLQNSDYFYLGVLTQN